MAAHILRLRLDLLLGALRAPQRLGTVVSFLAVIVLTGLLCHGILSLRERPLEVAAVVIVLGAAAVFLGFLLAPILSGARDQLDPRRFTPFGVDERRMPAMLAVASLISVPSMAVIAVAVCTAIVAIEHGVPGLLAIVFTVLGAASVLLAARLGLALSAVLLPERRPRELTALFALAVAVIAFPVAIFLASQEWGSRIPAAVVTAAEIAGVTPLAAAPAAMFALASGEADALWLNIVIALVAAVGLWLLWNLLVRHLLTSTQRPGVARERAGLGWFAVMPPSAFGGIAARSLGYWLSDRRHIVNMLIVPVVGVLAALPLLFVGMLEKLVLLRPVLVMALFFGWLPHNDVAYESTAFWIHIASGVGGFADRLGRLVPVVVVAIPVLAAALTATVQLVDDWSIMPELAATAACLLLAGLGWSSMTSVLAPYPVARPGDSPFQQPQRAGAGMGHAIALLGTLAVSAPVLWLLYQHLANDEPGDLIFWGGLGVGAGMLVLGVSLGALAFRLRGDRLMEFASAHGARRPRVRLESGNEHSRTRARRHRPSRRGTRRASSRRADRTRRSRALLALRQEGEDPRVGSDRQARACALRQEVDTGARSSEVPGVPHLQGDLREARGLRLRRCDPDGRPANRDRLFL